MGLAATCSDHMMSGNLPNQSYTHKGLVSMIETITSPWSPN